MAQLDLQHTELMNPGHLGCPGCGATIAMKFALQALGEKTMAVIWMLYRTSVSNSPQLNPNEPSPIPDNTLDVGLPT